MLYLVLIAMSVVYYLQCAYFFLIRFRMSRELFVRIMKAVEDHDDYFVMKRNAAGVAGLSGFQKITAVLRILCYGMPADATDEYCRVAESTALESLRRFTKDIIEIFGEVYLRTPNENDTSRLLAIAEERGFPGMLGSIDCMHWSWKNCPSAWQGMFSGHHHKPTIIL